jgi:putative ABC transport system permease protein
MPLRLALAWIASLVWIAPASRRTTWRAQWEAELWHYWQWLERERGGAPASAWRVLTRAAGALPHAARLRASSWSPDIMLHDLRFAWRLVLRRPAFTAVAVLILGLGIGANATIFSWIETTLLEPLPVVRDERRLVSLRGTSASRNDLSFSYLNYVDLRAAHPDGLDDVIAFRGLALNLRVDSEPIRVWGELVTDNFFDVLRVRVPVGRAFQPADAAAPGKEPVAVLSDRLWKRLFAGDPGVLSRAVSINGQTFTVIGVAEEGFVGSMAGVNLDVFIPITMQKAVMSGDRLPMRGNSFLQVFARLRPGAHLSQAQASASVVAARLADRYPNENAGRGVRVIPLWRDGTSGFLMPVMATLMAVVGLVLLIACANLAGLLLARAAGRQREVAVRLALGASRGRLVRQFLMESLLLALAGGIAGIALSVWTSGLLRVFIPRTPMPIGFDAGVSPTVIGFAMIVTCAAAVAFGLVPALRASRSDVTATLKDAAASLSTGRRRGRLRQLLVVSQIALSLVLLVCAALFARSLQRARYMDPGFDLRRGILAALDLLPGGYDEPRGIAFYQQLLSMTRALPGVEGATLTQALPLDLSSGSDMGVSVDGYQRAEREEITAYYSRVAPRYFETMGIPIVSGRGIDDGDVAGHEVSVVVNETMARRYWPGGNAVGRIVRFGNGPARVVGIAKDGKYSSLNEEPRNYMYLPLYQMYRSDVALVVRTSGEPAAALGGIKSALARLDSSLPLFDVRTVDEHMQLILFIPRMVRTVLTLFGGLALLLATVGLYSVIAFAAAQRTREIGIRMALGAARRDVVRLIVRQGVVLVVAGTAIGLVLAFAATRLIAGQLVAVGARDPVSFAATVALLAVISVLACVVPALRAARLDPVAALRGE